MLFSSISTIIHYMHIPHVRIFYRFVDEVQNRNYAKYYIVYPPQDYQPINKLLYFESLSSSPLAYPEFFFSGISSKKNVTN